MTYTSTHIILVGGTTLILYGKDRVNDKRGDKVANMVENVTKHLVIIAKNITLGHIILILHRTKPIMPLLHHHHLGNLLKEFMQKNDILFESQTVTICNLEV